MKKFKDVWEDAAANSVSGGGVDMPADVQHDKKKRRKAVYDGRTKEGRKFVEKMLARRKAKELNASKQNADSVSMKEENQDKKDTKEAKKPVSKMTPAEKAADAKRRKEYNAYQKSKRNETVEEAKAPKIKGLSLYGSEVTGLRAKDGKLYSAKPVVMGGKLAYRVTDEFGSFETLPLKKFAAKFG